MTFDALKHQMMFTQQNDVTNCSDDEMKIEKKNFKFVKQMRARNLLH